MASLVLLAAGAGAYAFSEAPPVQPTPTAVELRPGVIIDLDRGAIYLMSPHRGIDALDVTSGKLKWTTSRAAKPLLLHREVLLAQADGRTNGSLRLVGLKAGDGTPVFEAQAELPEGVSASIDESLGVSFAASARLDHDHVLVSWRFMRQRIRGIAPEPGESVVRQQASGVVRIDARSGHVESSRTGEVPPEPELPETVARLVKSGKLRGPVWRGGAVLAAIRERGDDTGPVIVSRWDRRTGRALPDIALLAAGLGLHHPSADGRFLLATKLAAPAGPAGAKFIWIIFSLETGERVAELRNDLPEARFLMWRSTLVHEAPPGIRAIDLDTGAEVWSRPIRDTSYRGPYPPGR